MFSLIPLGKHRRTIILYSLAIFLPGLVLSVMAYRGIQGEKNRLEKIQSQRMSRTGINYFEEVDKSIYKKLADLSKEDLIYNEGFFDFKKQETRIEFYRDQSTVTLITIGADSTLSILQNSTLYVPERQWDGMQQKKPGISSLSICLYEEFDNKGQNKAQQDNQYLFDKSENKMLKVQSIMNQARLYRKLNQHEKLRSAYRDIYEFTKDPDIICFTDKKARELMGQTISYWITSNNFSSNVYDMTLPAMEIIAFIAIPQIYLPQSYYHQCMQDCRTLRNKLIPADLPEFIKLTEIDSLLDAREAAIHKQDVFVRLTDQIYKFLYQSGGNKDELMGRSFPYYEDSVSFYTAFTRGKNNLPFALVIDMRELLISISPGLLDNSNNINSWRITGENNKAIISSSGFLPKKGLDYDESPINLGVWKLQLQAREKIKLNLAITARESVYLAGFIFVIVGLAFGMILTIRGLAKENRLARLKSEFISSVSHDFKSPVTSIRQMTELLERDRIPTEERKKEYYSTMLAQSEKLTHLVDNILDFARLEHSPKELRNESVYLDQLLRGVIETFNIRLRYTGFTINASFPDSLPAIMVDREGMHQLFYNLLDNAYKYSGKSKVIAVSMKLLPNEVEVIVQDFGIGIHTKDQKKIFKRYFRSQVSELNSIKGTGIGLAIVQDVVKAHKGRLELVSQPGMGSSFKVYLPTS